MKIKSGYLGKYPIWVILDDNGEQIDFCDRKKDEYGGYTKEELQAKLAAFSSNQ